MTVKKREKNQQLFLLIQLQKQPTTENAIREDFVQKDKKKSGTSASHAPDDAFVKPPEKKNQPILKELATNGCSVKFLRSWLVLQLWLFFMKHDIFTANHSF